jgi:elongation factor P hydroxylase
MNVHQYQDLIRIFSECFELEYNTRLICGTNEPLYLPADKQCSYHRIIFAHGFFSSALHECAHWLIAGEIRRTLVDYGYWYVPDGRSAKQQVLFQQVEVKPQALEWLLSEAAGYRFQFSIDNLSGEISDTALFKEAVCQQVLTYRQNGLPPRANSFREALARF